VSVSGASATRVLIVEDEPDIAGPLRENLEVERYAVRVAATGEAGLDALRSWNPDVMVLDLMLPGMSGETLLQLARAEGRHLPVLILSAKGTEIEKVRGLRLGADDYVTKPFGLMEVIARIEALVRRARSPVTRPPDALAIGHIEIRPAARQVLRDGEPVDLRPREMDLLLALLQQANQAVSRQDLLVSVWGYDPSVDSRTVDWHVAELRSKIERDTSAPAIIQTVRKVGYRLMVGGDHAAGQPAV